MTRPGSEMNRPGPVRGKYCRPVNLCNYVMTVNPIHDAKTVNKTSFVEKKRKEMNRTMD